jgi:hypothetical protein
MSEFLARPFAAIEKSEVMRNGHTASCGSVIKRALRQIFSVSILFLACCTLMIAPYNSDVAKDIQLLLKKVDTIYYDMIAALTDAQTNPGSAEAQKALNFSNFRKDWHDILSDSDVLKVTACGEPNNEDTCAIVTDFFTDLSKFEENLASQGIAGVGQPALRISQTQMRDRLELLLHDENYKQNAGSSGSSGAGATASGSAKSKSGGP